MNSALEAYWGPIVFGKDYQTWLEGDTFGDPMIELQGHSVGSPDIDMSDPLSVPKITRERGQMVTRTEFIKPAMIRSRSYEIRFAEGRLWSPLARIADEGGKACRRNVFNIYSCPAVSCHAHAWRYVDVMFDPVQEDADVVSNGEDEEALVWKTMMHTQRRLNYMYLRAHETYDQSAASPVPIFNDTAFNAADCDNCQTSANGRHRTGWLVGGDNAAVTPAPLLLFSDGTRFASFTDRSANLPAGSNATLARRVLAKGDTAFITLNDATNSEIAITFDTGANFALATLAGSTTFTGTLLSGIFYGAGYYWAVGTASRIYRSRTGGAWTLFALPTGMAATHVFTAGAYDPYSQSIYVVGRTTGGNALVIRIDGDTAVDITSTVFAVVPASPLTDVRVLADDHIGIVGEDGVFVENPAATRGGTWNQVATGTTSDLRVILGDDYRTVIGTDAGSTGVVLERGVLTGMEVRQIEIFAGAVGDGFIGGDTGDSFTGVNDFVLNTGAEVYIVKTCAPDA